MAVTSVASIGAVGAIQHPLTAVLPVEGSFAAVASIRTVVPVQGTLATVPPVRAVLSVKHMVTLVASIRAVLSVQSASSAAIPSVLALWREVSLSAPATFPPVVVSVVVTFACLVAGVHVASTSSLPLQAVVSPASTSSAVHTAAVLLVVVIIVVVIVEDSVVR